jgi:hypothetical protein
VRIEKELCSADDVDATLAACQSHDAAGTVLDLQLSGRLSAAERTTLDEGIAALRPTFLHVSVESEIHERLSPEHVASRYRSGGLVDRLLTALLADEAHPDAALLADELVVEARKR